MHENTVKLGLFKPKFLLVEISSSPFQCDEGKMVDASFVETPRQRNTREELRSAHEYLLK